MIHRLTHTKKLIFPHILYKSPMATKGTLYSMRNPTFRNEMIRKIGFTTRHVKKRLGEANSETYSLPEWEVEFAKEVDDVIQAEKKIHTLLETLNMRMYPNYPRKEFFQVSYEIIRQIFDLIPGTYYSVTDHLPSEIELVPNTNTLVQDDEHADSVSESEDVVEDAGQGAKGKRDMREYLTDKMRIRHRLANNDEWIGIYDRDQNLILYGGTNYFTPTAFANDHNVQILGGQPNKRSGWNECFAEVSAGEWKRLKTLDLL